MNFPPKNLNDILLWYIFFRHCFWISLDFEFKKNLGDEQNSTKFYKTKNNRNFKKFPI